MKKSNEGETTKRIGYILKYDETKDKGILVYGYSIDQTTSDALI